MSRFPRIESRQNPRIKNLVKLRTTKERRSQGLCLIEGELELTRAIAAGVPLRELYLCPEHWRDERAANELISQAESQQAKVFELTRECFEKISLREGSDGLFGVAEFAEARLTSLKLPDEPLLVIVEGIEKPGNLGALIRTAEAAGANALIACNAVTDFFNPQVIRNSRGLVFSLPCLSVDSDALKTFLTEKSIRTAATTPAADATHWDADLRGPLAILAGAEHEGLSNEWLAKADIKLRIPMRGEADSLNVNTATAIVLFEALRQRS
ncbi:TrmH family RNA methyltransferase [Cerasicoccus fimbriatus]|uniref:TrmH family RNA methyltransferase n=1 Tax=Cerasicoccus fimbriatus TaxID=3014554 RepID=UPI0022B5D659|nr:TrmH family RNA methyltransferase [Cerasicoccus sp. TK19100]